LCGQVPKSLDVVKSHVDNPIVSILANVGYRSR